MKPFSRPPDHRGSAHAVRAPYGRRFPDSFRIFGFILTSGAAWLIPLLGEPGNIALFASAFGTILFCYALFIIAGRLAPSLVVPRLAILSYGLQSLWLASISLFGLPTTALGMGYPIDIADYPLLATAPLVLVPLAATLAAAILRAPALHSGSGILEQRHSDSPPGLNIILALAGIAMVAFWPATQPDSGRIGYMLRVLNYALFYMAFLAGLYGRGRALNFWWVCLVANAAISLTAGSRYFAFVPLALFLAGRVARAQPERRVRVLALSVFIMAGTILVSGLVGLARGRVGRSEFEDVTVDRGVEMAKGWLDVLGDVAHMELAMEGFGRMVTWANPAVCILTPGSIPYRGLDTFWSEVKASLSLSELSGTTRADALDVGLYQGPANLYGFSVSATNSVEFPLLADGWSRGGPWAALGFGCVAISLGSIAEIIAVRARRRWPTPALTLFVIAGKLSMDIAGLPLIASVRSLLLNGCLVVLLSMMAAWLTPSVSRGRNTFPLAPQPDPRRP